MATESPRHACRPVKARGLIAKGGLCVCVCVCVCVGGGGIPHAGTFHLRPGLGLPGPRQLPPFGLWATARRSMLSGRLGVPGGGGGHVPARMGDWPGVMS